MYIYIFRNGSLVDRVGIQNHNALELRRFVNELKDKNSTNAVYISEFMLLKETEIEAAFADREFERREVMCEA